MKLWTEAQIFFIYDMLHCVREEDDPRDAILYFHPPQIPEDVRCGLCCQLMGMTQWCTSSLSPPTMIRLTRMKFTIRIIGRYTFVLRGSLDMPDSILGSQLDSLYQLFQFYHNSVDAVFKKCDLELSKFLIKLEDLFDFYLPISQHFGNTSSLTFNVLPILDLPKSAGSLFLRASQILRACQTKRGVIAGCILSQNQIVCSQLSQDIASRLCSIPPINPQIPAEELVVTFPLPAGIKIVTVYLTEKELLEAQSRNDFFVSAMPCKSDGNAATGSTLISEHSEAPPSRVKKFWRYSMRRTPCACDNNQKLLSRKMMMRNLQRPGNADLRITGSAENIFSASVVDLCCGGCSSDSNSQWRSFPNLQHASELVMQTLTLDRAVCALKRWKLELDRITLLQTITLSNMRLDPVCSGSCVSSKLKCANSAFRVTELPVAEETKAPSSLHELCLYIQGHSETQLILLMEEATATNADAIISIWKSGLSSLVDLEMAIKSCLESAPKKESSSKYLYTQYDQIWHTLKGDLSTTWLSSPEEQVFSRSVQLLHDTLICSQMDSDPDALINECSVTFDKAVIFAHRQGSTETYYQQQCSGKKGLLAVTDTIANISSRARRRLRTDLDILLL